MRMGLRYFVLLIVCALVLYILLVLSGRNTKSDPFPSYNIPDNNREIILKSKLGEDEKDEENEVQVEKDGNSFSGHLRVAKAHSRAKQSSHSRKLPRGKISAMGPHHQNEVGVTCSPRENVTFIKVHKTGSSTVQNIFLRYGDKHNLQFVLPPHGHHLGYPNSFDTRHMLHNEKDSYNIFCHHARFSQAIPRVVPPNTYYITIVRDPVKVFESSFIYFKMDYRLGMTNDPQALQKFLEDAETYYKNIPNKVHMKNTMLYDLGVPLEDFASEDLMKKAIKTFHKRFRLVMVAEYFEESLILLRDLLCWTTEDVVVFKLNTRKDDSIVPLSEGTKLAIREWNNGDVLLYEHFNRTIQLKIEEYGRARMAQEVAVLRQKTQELYERCIQSDTADKEHGDFKVWQPFGVHINAFVLKPEQKGNKACERMIMPEIQYTKELRKKQFPDLKDPGDLPRMKQIKGKRKMPLV